MMLNLLLLAVFLQALSTLASAVDGKIHHPLSETAPSTQMTNHLRKRSMSYAPNTISGVADGIGTGTRNTQLINHTEEGLARFGIGPDTPMAHKTASQPEIEINPSSPSILPPSHQVLNRNMDNTKGREKPPPNQHTVPDTSISPGPETHLANINNIKYSGQDIHYEPLDSWTNLGPAKKMVRGMRQAGKKQRESISQWITDTKEKIPVFLPYRQGPKKDKPKRHKIKTSRERTEENVPQEDEEEKSAHGVEILDKAHSNKSADHSLHPDSTYERTESSSDTETCVNCLGLSSNFHPSLETVKEKVSSIYSTCCEAIPSQETFSELLEISKQSLSQINKSTQELFNGAVSCPIDCFKGCSECWKDIDLKSSGTTDFSFPTL